MYNPADHKVQNQPFGVGAIPLNGKTLFYNTTKLVYRPFVNVAELEAYFAIHFKTPDFESIVNTGGTLNATTGKITGGTNDAYWFPNGATAVLKKTNIDISLYYTSAQTDIKISDAVDAFSDTISSVAFSGEYNDLLNKPWLMEPWPDTIVFTYDGTNNSHELSFTPKSVGGGNVIQGSNALDPYIDFYFEDNHIILKPYLFKEGIEYTLLINYFK